MKIELFKVNAFAKTQSGGNPAGVVLNGNGLSEQQMQEIAKRAGFSETAFVSSSEKADFCVRFFTPSSEVDLCGHATIATFSLMSQKGLLQVGSYKQETKAGVLNIEVQKDHQIFMEQNKPIFGEQIDLKRIASILGINPNFISETGLSPMIVSTGLPDILVGIKNREALFSIKPNFEEMKVLSKELDIIGVHVFTFDTLNEEATAHCRNFAPFYDIDEEAATGTASGALACYLFNEGGISKEETRQLIFEQGYSMDRPSEIKASLNIREDMEIIKVQVGGIAVIEKTLSIDLNS